MKILIAYDGSQFAEAAIEDLRNAGLPSVAEALVLTVSDVFVPPSDQIAADDEFLPEPPSVRRAHERAKQKLRKAETEAQAASERIKKQFPDWKVSHEALAESPAWAIIFKAAEWEADLIVVGSHGRSGLAGRFILGSVSQRVLYEAHCSVRIGRRAQQDTPPLRLLIGVDGSEHSRAAVAAVAKRSWPKGTEARLLIAVDTVVAVNQDTAVKWIEVSDEDNWEEVRQLFQPQANTLQTAGLDAAVMIRRGHPTQQILDEAESWSAHSVFLGAKGIRGIERLVLGSVSAAVAARAGCSVEVVRPRTK